MEDEEEKMRIAIIGTTAYQDKMQAHKEKMELQGHQVDIPAFDSHPELDAFGICKYNRGLIREADEVHIFWDQRSMGTVLDFGMAFMADKPIRIIYMESKTLRGVMEEYEREVSHARD